MGIDLGGRNISMAKHFLNASKISAMAQKMGGKGVPQHMR
jgi:chemotaxis receptor (MCP) glutamine deamidase CheD